jgi:CTP synthase (UTP-ammonia lyase)
VKTIALVGDFDARHVAHVAIPQALELACGPDRDLDWVWLPTDRVRALERFAGFWLVPASPYRSMDGALRTVRHARERNLPFLGTCGGFQHALIEFARHAARIREADHAESNPRADELVVTPLACPLVGQRGAITYAAGSQLAGLCGPGPWEETYNCGYGLNAFYREALESAGLRFSGFDPQGQIRAFELPANRFHCGVLFQPERSALERRRHPLVGAFAAAVRSSPAGS